MSIFSRARKAVKRVAKKVGGKLPAIQGFKAVKGFFKTPEEDESSDETGLRSAAAKRLVTKTDQAGGGQIKYNTEEEVE